MLKPLVGYGGVESVGSSDSADEGVALTYSWSTTTDHGSDDRYWIEVQLHTLKFNQNSKCYNLYLSGNTCDIDGDTLFNYIISSSDSTGVD